MQHYMLSWPLGWGSKCLGLSTWTGQDCNTTYIVLHCKMQVAVCRQKAKGSSLRKIATEIGISRTTVSEILKESRPATGSESSC